MTRATLALITVLAVACTSSPGQLTVSQVRIGMPTGPNAALYLTAEANGDADRLVGATTEVADHVELHESVVDVDGTTAMAPVEGFDLDRDGTLVLEPGGGHLMLVAVDRLAVGEIITVFLTWEQSGLMAIQAEVVEPGETVSHDR